MNAVNITKGVIYTTCAAGLAVCGYALYEVSKEVSKITLLKTAAISVPIFSLIAIGALHFNDYLPNRYKLSNRTIDMIKFHLATLSMICMRPVIGAALRGSELVPSLNLAMKVSGIWMGFVANSFATVFIFNHMNIVPMVVQRISTRIRTYFSAKNTPPTPTQTNPTSPTKTGTVI